MAKILAVNGSPNKAGNTARMLRSVLEVCAAAGNETEFYQAGGRPVRGCLACGGCGTHLGRCSVDDWLNELYPKLAEADAIVLGSPTYFADITPELKAVIDRAGYISRRDGMRFSRKIGAAVCPMRRAGSIHALDSIQHFFLINDMVVPGSTYWNLGVGDFEQDAEGVGVVRRLGENIAWLAERLK